VVSGDTDLAGEFEQLFRAVYLTFHRRDAPRSQLPNVSLAVLEPAERATSPRPGRQRDRLRRCTSTDDVAGDLAAWSKHSVP
jgi:hypothetical protein